MLRKPVLDYSRILSVHHTVTDGRKRWRPPPGMRRTGSSTWYYRDGTVSGWIGHTVEIDDENTGRLRLHYTLNGEEVRQVFALAGRPCRFGGVRWLALCPRTGKALAKLYGCRGTFQPRHLIDASYRSQDRVPATEKLRDREVALLRRLGADDKVLGDPPKPKWMRWPTYSRLALELRATRYQYTVAMARDLYRLTGHDVSEGAVPEIAGRRS